MRYWLNFVSFLCFFPLLFSFTANAETKVIERVVAVVNGKVILLSELQANAKQLAKELEKRGEKSQQKDDEGFERKVLDQLINHELVSEEVRRKGLDANDSVVDNAITSVMAQNGMKSAKELEKALAEEGLTPEAYRENIKRQIEDSRLMSDIIRPRVNITESDIRGVYEREYASKDAKTRYRVSMIFKKGESGEKALEPISKSIKAGGNFEELANAQTEGPGKGEGGTIGVVDPENLHPKLASALKELRPNEVSKVITNEQGAYLLKLVEKVKEGKVPYAQVREEIEEKLRREETNRKFESFLRTLRENALIEVML